MKEEFASKVYVGDGGGSLVLKILLFAVSAVITVAVLIKVIVGDFRIADVSGILLALLVIAVARSNIGSKPRYAFVNGSIEFKRESMVIRYKDIDGGKKIGRFDETYCFCYDDIEQIAFGRELSCFRLTGPCRHVRKYYDFGQVREQILSDGEMEEEVFLYVLEDAEAMKEKLQQHTGCEVYIAEKH